MSLLLPNQTILFQGDSITDAGRSRDNDSNLGSGYANMIAAWLGAKRPHDNLKFINRGISGNRVIDLKNRWTNDCINLKPDWVSIYIGINDTWRRYDSNDPTSAESYANTYREILQRVKKELVAKVIMIEPFVLPFPADRKAWREDLDLKIIKFRELAAEFKAYVIPLDGIFSAAAAAREAGFFAEDGVHPSQAGHALITQHWLRAVGEF